MLDGEVYFVVAFVGVAIGLHEAKDGMAYRYLLSFHMLYPGATGDPSRNGPEHEHAAQQFREPPDNDDVKQAIGIIGHRRYAEVVAELLAVGHDDHECPFAIFFAVY